MDNNNNLEFSGLQGYVKTLELELDLAIDEARLSILSDLLVDTINDNTDDTNMSCVDTAVFWSSEDVLSPNGKLVKSITKDLSNGNQSIMKCVLQEVSVDESYVQSSPQRQFFDMNSIVNDDEYHVEYRVANLDDEFKKAFDRQEKVSADELKSNFLRDSDDDSIDKTRTNESPKVQSHQLFAGPDEMEYVLPILVTDTIAPVMIEPAVVKAPSVSPIKSRILDKRVFGDAAGWDKGSRMTVEGIKQAYGGLYDTLFHTGNYKNIYVQEFVVRPDTQLVMLMNAIAIAAKSIQLVFSRRQRSQGIISHPTRTGVPSPSKSRSIGRGRWTEAEEDEEEEKEWDAVDVQVCVSRELRHRVVLCQFLQKTRSSGAAMRNTDQRNAANSRIERVNKAIQKQLTNSGLCLSNLYQVVPAQVCEEFQVDSHFFVQMENLHREQMWQTLEREFASMDRHFQIISDEYVAFVKAMQHVYTQHGILSTFPSKATRDDPEDTLYRNRSVMLNEASELVPHTSISGSELSMMGDATQTTATALSPKLLGQEDLSSKSASSKSFPPTQAAEPSEEYTDGMTKCLACLSLLGRHLMKGCDRELTFRLQKQNAAIVTKMSRLNEHTKLLLFRLAESDSAEVSSLNRTLLSSFDGVTLSSPTSFSRFLSSSALTLRQTTSAPITESPRRSLFGNFMSSPVPAFAPAPVTASVTTNSSSSLSAGTSSATRSLSREEDVLYKFSSQPLSTRDGNSALGWGGGIYKLVAMYTCAVLVSALSLPGSIYITPEFIFVISGIQIPGISISMSTQRECYSLRHLKSVTAVTNSSLPFITSNTLELAFYEDTKTLYITPVAVNKGLLQSVIFKVKENFVGL